MSRDEGEHERERHPFQLLHGHLGAGRAAARRRGACGITLLPRLDPRVIAPRPRVA
jgi:hypothetical protein